MGMAKKVVRAKSVLARRITGEVKIMAVSDKCFVDVGLFWGGDSFPLTFTSVLSPAKSFHKMCLCLSFQVRKHNVVRASCCCLSAALACIFALLSGERSQHVGQLRMDN